MTEVVTVEPRGKISNQIKDIIAGASGGIAQVLIGKLEDDCFTLNVVSICKINLLADLEYQSTSMNYEYFSSSLYSFTHLRLCEINFVEIVKISRKVAMN